MIRSKWNFIVIIIGLIIISGIFYYYENIRIPTLTKGVEASIRKEIDFSSMPTQKVAVVMSEEGILKYTEITQDIIDSKINMIEIPVKFIPNGSVQNIEEIRGKITKETLRNGEQLMLDSFSKNKKWFEKFERLKEYTINSTVADTLESGNIVDILVIYGNGDYDVVVPKVKVKKLVAGKNSNNQENEIHQIVIPVNEIESRDLIAANELGKFDVRIYLDESQEASPKTFNYNLAKKQLNLRQTTSKINNDE